jgi:hypothetical protein
MEKIWWFSEFEKYDVNWKWDKYYLPLLLMNFFFAYW